MQGSRPPLPRSGTTRQAEEGSDRGELAQKAAALLEERLNVAYGCAFAEVVEHEFRRALNTGFYDALRADPTGAKEILTKIFGSEYAVGLILETVSESLLDPEVRAEGQELFRVIRHAWGPAAQGSMPLGR